MTAHERYRPVVDLGTGRPALDCGECRGPEGWPGVRVWTAPETTAFDLTHQLSAVDEHERTYHAADHDEED